MIDIWVAITVMMVISLLCSLVTGGVLYIREGQSSMLFIALAVLATVVFQIYVSGQLFLAQWIPSTAAVIYTNFSACFAAAAAGWAWRVPKTPAWRRAFFGSVSRASIGAGALLASGLEGVAAGSSRGGAVARRGGVTKCQSDLQPCGCSHTFASAWNRGGRA